MGLLEKIIPFYGAIEQVVKAGGDAIRADQDRRTLRTKTELEVELKKRCAEIEERQKSAQHERDLVRLEREADIADLPAQRDHDRQLAFETHRVDLFERIKRTELEIHQQIQAFDIAQQKEIREWERQFIQRLEDEAEGVMTDRVPRMLASAEPYRDRSEIYDQYIGRVFSVADKIAESIAADQTHFRDALRELAERPGKLTDSLVELNRRLQFASPAVGTLPPATKK